MSKEYNCTCDHYRKYGVCTCMPKQEFSKTCPVCLLIYRDRCANCNTNIAEEPTVCVESADSAARRFAGENIELTKEIERLKAELCESEVTYGVYIDGLHKDIKKLTAKNEYSRREICKLRGAAIKPMRYPDLSVEKSNYERIMDEISQQTGIDRSSNTFWKSGPEKGDAALDKKITEMNAQENLIAFTDGSYKKIKFSAWKHSQWIHYTRPSGKQVRINPANVNYIEEV